jgi:3-methyladenine DNA glycosylase AlkD
MENSQINLLIKSFQKELEEVASPKTKSWWEGYMKYVIPFLGVGISTIRDLLSTWRKEKKLAQLGKEQELAIALSFFEESFAEDKLTGILYLQDYLSQQFDGKVLFTHFRNLYRKQLIFNWNVCDWFCVRVLGPGIKLHGRSRAEALASWKDEPYLWQARSALVPFVKVVRTDEYYPLIKQISATLIRREERFAKTAVGWILRDISKYNDKFVTDFLENQLTFFTIETIRNATKQMNVHLQRIRLDKLKETTK